MCTLTYAIVYVLLHMHNNMIKCKVTLYSMFLLCHHSTTTERTRAFLWRCSCTWSCTGLWRHLELVPLRHTLAGSSRCSTIAYTGDRPDRVSFLFCIDILYSQSLIITVHNALKSINNQLLIKIICTSDYILLSIEIRLNMSLKEHWWRDKLYRYIATTNSSNYFHFYSI